MSHFALDPEMNEDDREAAARLARNPDVVAMLEQANLELAVELWLP